MHGFQAFILENLQFIPVTSGYLIPDGCGVYDGRAENCFENHPFVFQRKLSFRQQRVKRRHFSICPSGNAGDVLRKVEVCIKRDAEINSFFGHLNLFSLCYKFDSGRAFPAAIEWKDDGLRFIGVNLNLPMAEIFGRRGHRTVEVFRDSIRALC